jgi:hypothetical protein
VTQFLVGERVVLDCPDNPHLDGTVAWVESMESWGAHLRAPHAATGKCRALFSEMIPFPEATVAPTPPPVRAADTRDRADERAREAGYSGDACSACGSFRMKRTGVCLCCEDCGSTSGGCS